MLCHAFGIRVRKIGPDPGGMKQRPSKLLAAVIADLDKPARMTKGTKAILAFLGNYPFNFREDVFC